ncbi:RNA ligase [Rivularia sp. PCC 7116]|uniref:RNA ligase family protein n=1 Tax=Rivularia sp. PCC 7116 TaxID=373994 RepID=UPI00029EC4C3|nr:RNA ligase family protein [Rivularia sp. PCC 7116]AFY57020.1 RNA ligase [Rivularia sp. PCC 7116]
MDTEYIAYEKIPENPNQWNLTESDYRIFKKSDWVVTEKIHGANFGIVTDGLEVRFAKRKQFLDSKDNFFGYQLLQDKLILQAKEIFKILQVERINLNKVFIYGELFGGEYPHPEVTPVCGVQAIQTGVYYSPNIEYCAFDIGIVENTRNNHKIYLDYDIALQLFAKVGMMAAKPLFIGKYEEAAAYNIEFESTIPAILNLPQLQQSNKAEGIVIKPVKSFYIETRKGRIRPIIKYKIPEFAEDSRYHQAQKWNYQKTLNQNQNQHQELSFEDELCQEMLALVTATRLDNVISKLGRITNQDIDKIPQLVDLLQKDVLESFYEEYESIFKDLSVENQKNMMVELHRASLKLLNGYLMSLKNGL